MQKEKLKFWKRLIQIETTKTTNTTKTTKTTNTTKEKVLQT